MSETCIHGNAWRPMSQQQECSDCAKLVEAMKEGSRLLEQRTDEDRFVAYVAKMRAMGETGPLEGFGFKVGSAPPEQGPPITEASVRRAREATSRQNEALLYASSEGFPVDDEASR